MVRQARALFSKTRMEQDTVKADSATEVQSLLEETLELTKANHKILRRMERNALIGFFAKVFLWLLILGVPLFFFGPYLKSLFSLASGGTTGSPTTTGVFGLPSAEQLQEIIQTYKPK